MNRIDLHVHSTKSDGSLTPAELVEYAVKKSLSAIALTDHDTADGIDEALAAAHLAAANGKKLTVIPGIEFSTEYEGRDIHVLGLFIDHKNEFFKDRLAHFVRSRTRRNEEMCEKLREAGVDIAYEMLLAEFPGCVITRAHYAAWLLRHGYTRSRQEGFDRFVGDRARCFVPRKKITPFRALEIIRKAGGLPILAHPLLYHLNDTRLERLVAELAAAGLGGLEAIYSSHAPAEERQMRRLAAKYQLALSGGSDFHGAAKPGLDLGSGYGRLFVPETILDELLTERKKGREKPGKYLPKRILFTDLDGTLLNDQKEISPYTREILGAWCQAGHRLVLSSGRDINSVKELVRDLELQYPGMILIGSNGGRIYDCDQKEFLYKISLTREQALHIIRTAREQGIHCHSYSDTHIIVPAATEELVYYQHAIKTPVLFAADFESHNSPNYPINLASALPEDPCKCIAIELKDRAKLERFRDSLLAWAGKDITLVFSSPIYLELYPTASGKGKALRKLCEILNIPRGLSVAAGDQENDLSMLNAAGYAIAMCNGTEGVKKAATTVTAFDNNHDGLAHELAALLGYEIPNAETNSH